MVDRRAETERSSRAATSTVLIDVLGTLAFLGPPTARLRAELERSTGIAVGEEAAHGAFSAEIAFYLAHHLDGHDRPSLERLRDRCAGVMARSLSDGGYPELAAASVRPLVRTAMLRSLRFGAYVDAAPALRELRRRGLRIVVASNWDCSLPEVLEHVGLAPLLDRVVSSASVGAAKPNAAVLEAALAAAGCEPQHAVHVGDSLEHDVEGARRAGVRPILLRRGEAGESVGRAGAAAHLGAAAGSHESGVTTIGSLAELASVI